jgi:hypothetical protein
MAAKRKEELTRAALTWNVPFVPIDHEHPPTVRVAPRSPLRTTRPPASQVVARNFVVLYSDTLPRSSTTASLSF